MNFPWAIVISLIVLIGAIVLGKLEVTLENDKWLPKIVLGSLVVYVVAAIAIGYLNPPLPQGQVDVNAIAGNL